jgi:hypothetical protein
LTISRGSRAGSIGSEAARRCPGAGREAGSCVDRRVVVPLAVAAAASSRCWRFAWTRRRRRVHGEREILFFRCRLLRVEAPAWIHTIRLAAFAAWPFLPSSSVRTRGSSRRPHGATRAHRPLVRVGIAYAGARWNEVAGLDFVRLG